MVEPVEVARQQRVPECVARMYPGVWSWKDRLLESHPLG